MGQRTTGGGTRAFVVAAACLACSLSPGLAACRHGEPPQWDGGPNASPSVAPLALARPHSPTPGDAGAVAPFGDPSPDASPPEAVSGESMGKLAQTRDRPDPSGPLFDARVRALFDGIARDDVSHAMPFFFPLSAYAQVKDIANPPADWKARLVAHYARDIHALHAKLGPNASRAHFVRADVPMDSARWVEPGEEYNRIGYYRVYGTKLVGELDGHPVSIDVTSLISWRGEWFIVHLSGTK